MFIIVRIVFLRCRTVYCYWCDCRCNCATKRCTTQPLSNAPFSMTSHRLSMAAVNDVTRPRALISSPSSDQMHNWMDKWQGSEAFHCQKRAIVIKKPLLATSSCHLKDLTNKRIDAGGSGWNIGCFVWNSPTARWIHPYQILIFNCTQSTDILTVHRPS